MKLVKGIIQTRIHIEQVVTDSNQSVDKHKNIGHHNKHHSKGR